MILVDSHCHLDILSEHHSYDGLVHRAFEENVHYIQTICTKLEDMEKIIAITKKYDNIFASVGIHPSEVRTLTRSEELIKYTKHPKVIGLGETGLDYYYNKNALQQQLQRKSFEEHIKSSFKSNLPVIVHTRESENDTYDIINSYKKMHNFPGLIHCFTASKVFARKILDLGFYISVSGIITFKNAEELRSIIKFIPLNRLLVETDSPYLTPVPCRGKDNEPSYLRHTAQALSIIKKVNLEECADQTTKNFFTLFKKAAKT